VAAAQEMLALGDARAVAIMSAKPKSAVVSVSTSGVLVTSTPRSVHAATSTLL